MKIILVQNPNKENQIKIFMFNKLKEAIHYATDMYALNFLLQTEIDIQDKNVIANREYYTKGEIRQIISNFIAHPYPKSFYEKIGEDFVWIYVIDLSSKNFWGK